MNLLHAAGSLRVSPNLVHLFGYLQVNGLVPGLPCDEGTLHTYSSEDVRQRICTGDPTWKQLVAPEVAAHIEAHGIPGFTCEI